MKPHDEPRRTKASPAPMRPEPTGLPRWDLTVPYSGLDSLEFRAAFQETIQAIQDLETCFERHRIAGGVQVNTLSSEQVQAFEEAIQAVNLAMDRAGQLSAYVSMFIATDSTDALAQQRHSELQAHLVRLDKLLTRLVAWLGTLPIQALMERSPVAAEHAHMLRRAHVQARHLMDPSQEDLAAELRLSGGQAWSRLYHNFTSQLQVSVELPEGSRVLPMSEVRNLAYHPDRSVREQAYRAELAAWEKAAVPVAAALNSIKGEANTLIQRRHWPSALAASYFQNNVDAESVEAMFRAAQEFLPDLRRYLRIKARLLGLEQLAWFDLFAPVVQSSHRWTFQEAATLIIHQFHAFSEKMGQLAERAFAEGWIDAEPRVGKRDGAFCMRLRGPESRVLVNFKPGYNAVRTLAHELGHAYHNLNLAHRPPLQRLTPMVLAETASTFCETLVREAALAQTDATEQLLILESALQDATQTVVDITSRFLFEQAVFEKRSQRELTQDELCQLMLEAQRSTYGDGLDSRFLHPYMWSVKPHYYHPGLHFYNYPYLFGLLFALGLYAQYRRDPEGFRSLYDDLLASTGVAETDELAARFGIDIHSVDFWRSSLALIREDVRRFEQLAIARLDGQQ